MSQSQPNKFIAVYLRVSTAEQAQAKEGSLVSQEQRCRDYLKLDYSDIPVIVYKEEGKSGKDVNRPEYQNLVADVKRGMIQAVCCTELSRVSRSVIDFLQFLDLCAKHGVGFISLREKFDTSTSYGKLIVSILASLAQFEREQISERTSANLMARAKRGLYNGGYVYGYKPTAGKPGYLEIIESEAILVNLMFDKYMELGSYCLVANWLNAQGYRTREYTRSSGKLKKAALWNDSSVVQCLRNLMYIGKHRIKDGSIVDGVWRPIVSLEKFDQAQKLLEKNMKSHGNGKVKRQHAYIFSGLIKCMHCDAPLSVASGTSRQGQVHFYYRHSPDKRKPDCSHPISLPALLFEQHILEHLTKILDDEKLIKMIWQEALKLVEEKQKSIQGEISAIAQKIIAIENEASGITSKLPILESDAIKEFVNPRLEEMLRQKKELTTRKEEIALQLVRVSRDMVNEEDISQMFHALSKDFWLLTENEKKDIAQEMIEKIELYEEKVVVFLKESRGGSSDPPTDSPLGGSLRTHQILISLKKFKEKVAKWYELCSNATKKVALWIFGGIAKVRQKKSPAIGELWWERCY